MAVKRFFVGAFCILAMTFGVILGGCASSPSTPSSSQNSGTLKNKLTGETSVLNEDGYFDLDQATRLYVDLSEDDENNYMHTFMVDDNDNFTVISIEEEELYGFLFQIYNEDKDAWGFDVSAKKGTLYEVQFHDEDYDYLGIVANFSFLDEYRFYVVPLN